VTCDARVDVHTAYVAVMRERALDERPDGARRETTREAPLCIYCCNGARARSDVLSRVACGHR
jgi:hypothetical protein